MVSPLRVLTLMLALVLGGQMVIAAIDPAEQAPAPQKSRSEGPGGGPYLKAKINFVDQDRLAIYNYYRDIAQSGACPVGLSRTEAGCMPGRDRAWRLGRQLPRDVVFHHLPADLAPRLSPAPAGYRYIRVGGDILLIARGSGIVVAAIEDLARL